MKKITNAIISRSFMLLLMVLLSSLLLVVSACDSSTSLKYGSVSGTVVLINDLDLPEFDNASLESVTVGLYKKCDYSSIVGSHVQYNDLVGSQFSQEYIFDHRDWSPLQTTSCNNQGEYKFSNVEEDEYNLVFVKESWGFRYVLNCRVSSGNNLVESVQMYPLRIVNNQESIPTVLGRDRVYQITNDVNINFDPVFESGTTVLLDQYVSMNVIGTPILSGEGLVRRIWSSDGIDELAVNNDRNKFNYIKFYSDVVLENFNISDAYTGSIVCEAGSIISESIIKDSTIGIEVFSVPVSISNCTFTGIGNLAISVLQASDNNPQIETVDISENIFHQCLESIRTNGHNMFINRNLFLSNSVAIVSKSGFHKIKNNVFSENNKSIDCYGSDAIISQNQFEEALSYHIGFYLEYHMSYFTPDIHLNNFSNTVSTYIHVYPYSIINDVSATENYWGSDSVEELIIDKSDDQTLGGYVLYLPKLEFPNPDAGIN